MSRRVIGSSSESRRPSRPSISTRNAATRCNADCRPSQEHLSLRVIQLADEDTEHLMRGIEVTCDQALDLRSAKHKHLRICGHTVRCGPLQAEYVAGNMEAADVTLPISERFANPNTARHELIDKLRIFALAEYFFATPDVVSD